MKAADLLVKALEHEGITHIFGVAGEENLDFVEALYHSTITLIPTRHEQSAGFIAATIGRLTGISGVTLSTLGPGATNFATSAAYATLGGMPMMMITGQKPIKSSKQGHFQIVDIVQMMKPITKFSVQISNANILASTVREAMRTAHDEKPGAVHIELPEDIAAEETEMVNLFPINKVRRPIAEEKAIAKAVDMIQSSTSPLILIGAGANRKLTSKMLLSFINKTNIPFFNTQMGKGVVDERHPNYIGCAALSSNDLVHIAIEKADLIINIGHDVIEKPPFIMKHTDKKQVIHINFSGAKVDNIYFPQHEVIGDIANAVWQISEKITIQNHWDFSNFLEIKKIIDEHIERDLDIDHFPLFPQKIVGDIRSVLPENGILTLDNGMYKLWFARNFRAYERNTFLLDNALATMGAGLPSAIGAKHVYPDRPVITVCGDGGFMMNSQEVETAVRLKQHIIIVIINDSGYQMIKWKQHSAGFTNHGLDFKNPDFVEYAKSYGARGHRVTRAAEFKELLQVALRESAVHIIDVPIDYSSNQTILEKELSQMVQDITSKK